MSERSWFERYIAGEDVEPRPVLTNGTIRDLVGPDGKLMEPGPFDENPIVKIAQAAITADSSS